MGRPRQINVNSVTGDSMRTLLDIWNTNCSGYSFIKFSPAIYCAGYFYTKIAVLRFILYPVPNGSGFHPSTDGLLSLIRKAIGLVSSTKRSASFSISVRTADYSTLAARTLFTTSARLCGCRISGFAPLIFYVFPFRLASPAMKTGTCPFFSRPFAPLFLCPS